MVETVGGLLWVASTVWEGDDPEGADADRIVEEYACGRQYFPVRGFPWGLFPFALHVLIGSCRARLWSTASYVRCISHYLPIGVSNMYVLIH